MPGGHQGESVRMLHGDAAHCVRQGLHVALPGLRQLDIKTIAHLSQKKGDDRLEEVLPPADVPVQGHRHDSQLLRQRTHGQALSTVAVDQLQGLPDDEVAVQSSVGPTAGRDGRFLGADVGHLVPVRGLSPPPPESVWLRGQREPPLDGPITEPGGRSASRAADSGSWVAELYLWRAANPSARTRTLIRRQPMCTLYTPASFGRLSKSRPANVDTRSSRIERRSAAGSPPRWHLAPGRHPA